MGECEANVKCFGDHWAYESAI